MTAFEQDSYVRTELCPLKNLHEFPGNAQVGDVPTIAASLVRNGQYRALIVRECDDGALVIMAGNHTAKALRYLGQPTARCEIHHCDDQTALRINLVDNRAVELAHTDNDLLIQQLSYFDGDYLGTGYDASFVQMMLNGFTPPPEDEPAKPAGGGGQITCPSCYYTWGKSE
jgi:hypothetical protein